MMSHLQENELQFLETIQSHHKEEKGKLFRGRKNIDLSSIIVSPVSLDAIRLEMMVINISPLHICVP